jgi:hypothetical protein
MEPEPSVLNPKNARRLGHLVLADLRERYTCAGDYLGAQRRIEDVATLAAGAGDDQHFDAFTDVARQRRGTLTGLVVRMRVNGKQAEWLVSHAQHLSGSQD